MYKIKFHKLNDSLKHYGRKGMKWGKNIFESLTGNGNNYKFGFEGNRWAGANPPSHIKVIEPSPQPAQAKKSKVSLVKNVAGLQLEKLKYKKKKEAINRPPDVEVRVNDKAENGVTLNSATNGIGRYDMYSDMLRGGSSKSLGPDYIAFDRKQTKKAYPDTDKLSAYKEMYNRGKVAKKFLKVAANSASRHQDLDLSKFSKQADRSDKEIAYQNYLKKHHPEKAKQRISNKW